MKAEIERTLKALEALPDPDLYVGVSDADLIDLAFYVRQQQRHVDQLMQELIDAQQCIAELSENE